MNRNILREKSALPNRKQGENTTNSLIRFDQRNACYEEKK